MNQTPHRQTGSTAARAKRTPLQIAGAIVVTIILVLARPYLTPSRSGTSTAVPSASSTGSAAETSILEAIKNQTSGSIVQARGTVLKLLDDDTDGTRHQRFLVKLDSGDVVKIAHNVDLAGRVPVAEQDEVEFHGQFEWNPQGAAVHWTHHDPRGKHPDGWIRHRGKRYE